MEVSETERLTKKFQIGALTPGCNTAMIVALIINKSDPRRVVSKKDGQERWVTTFTLRDSPLDMINFTLWSDRENAINLKHNYHIGEVVEIVRPRILQRDPNGRDSQYHPNVTSWLQLLFVDGKSMLAPYLGDPTPYQDMLKIPSKASSAFLSVADILTNSGNLQGHFVDILAAVRSVGVERKLKPREGDLEEVKITREVRLFDQTGDSLVLKLWDSELIALCTDWLPRENVLFLADVRIDYDSWRGSFVVTSTSKTIITINPDTAEAANLMRYAATVDFSTISRLDQYVSSLDTRNANRIVNTEMLDLMLSTKLTSSSQDCLVAVVLYGFITRFDIDNEEAVSLHCGVCSTLLKRDSRPFPACSNLECSEFSNTSPERVSPTQHYNVRADVTDENGTMAGIKIYSALLEKRLGSPSEFMMLSDETKTGFKWQVLMRPLKITIATLLPTANHQTSHAMIADLAPVLLEEVATKMPSPVA